MAVDRDEGTLRSLIPWRSATFHVIIASSLMGVMGVSLISPVLPELRDAFAISDAQVGLVITAYSLPGIFLTPVIGLVADRIGRKRVLVPLLLVFGAAGFAIAFTTDFTVVLGLRALQGVGATALVMLAVTLIGDLYEGAQLNALVGVNGSMIGIGAAVFPFVGGTLGEIRWNVPFFVYAVGVVVGLVAVVAVEEPGRDGGMNVRTYFGRMVAIARVRRALFLFAALFSTVFVFYGAIITALPLLLSDEFGLRPGVIGTVLAVVALTNAATASQYGRIAEARSGPALIALGFVAFGVGLIVLGGAASLGLVVLALLAFGVGLGVVFPSIDVTILTDVSEELRAGMMGMRTSMIRLGQTVGPIAFTGIADAYFAATVDGYRVLLLVVGGVVILGGGVTYLQLSR